MTKKYYAVVEFEAPSQAYVSEIKEFFLELQCAGGCRHPEDNLFDSFDNVKVVTLRRR